MALLCWLFRLHCRARAPELTQWAIDTADEWDAAVPGTLAWAMGAWRVFRDEAADELGGTLPKEARATIHHLNYQLARAQADIRHLEEALQASESHRNAVNGQLAAAQLRIERLTATAERHVEKLHEAEEAAEAWRAKAEAQEAETRKWREAAQQLYALASMSADADGDK